MSSPATAASTPKKDKLQLGDRNSASPARRGEYWMMCDLALSPNCEGERWVRMRGAMSRRTMAAVGWIKRCEPCSYRERGDRKTRTEDVIMPCGSTAHLRIRRNKGKEILVDCGVCGAEHYMRMDRKDAYGKGARRLGYCEDCKPWTTLALKPGQNRIASPERDALYAKIKRLREALESNTETPTGPMMPFWALVKCYSPTPNGEKQSALDDWTYYAKLLVLYFDEKPVGAIDTAGIFSFRDFLLTDVSSHGVPRSYNSVDAIFSWLRRVFNYAKWQRWIAENPLPKRDALIPSRLPLQARHLVTVAEEERILAVCVGDFAYLHAAIIYLADTGAYDADRRRLKWADVDFEKRVAKGRKAGLAKMTPRLYETLSALREQSGGAPDAPVFVQPRARHEFSKVRAAAGLAGVKLDDFRRTAAWRMAQAGMSIEQIAAQMGIINLDSVRQYLEVNPVAAQKEIASPAFQAFIREQFNVSVGGHAGEQKNGGAQKGGRPPNEAANAGWLSRVTEVIAELRKENPGKAIPSPMVVERLKSEKIYTPNVRLTFVYSQVTSPSKSSGWRPI